MPIKLIKTQNYKLKVNMKFEELNWVVNYPR